MLDIREYERVSITKNHNKRIVFVGESFEQIGGDSVRRPDLSANGDMYIISGITDIESARRFSSTIVGSTCRLTLEFFKRGGHYKKLVCRSYQCLHLSVDVLSGGDARMRFIIRRK